MDTVYIKYIYIINYSLDRVSSAPPSGRESKMFDINEKKSHQLLLPLHLPRDVCLDHLKRQHPARNSASFPLAKKVNWMMTHSVHTSKNFVTLIKKWRTRTQQAQMGNMHRLWYKLCSQGFCQRYIPLRMESLLQLSEKTASWSLDWWWVIWNAYFKEYLHLTSINAKTICLTSKTVYKYLNQSDQMWN